MVDKSRWHVLTGIDTEALTASCSQCGVVTIYRHGKAWRCGVHKKALRASYHYRTPRKSTYPSKHRLTWRDVELRLGLCPIDGEVEIVPIGRGWGCKVRALALGGGWRRAPMTRCAQCAAFDTEANPVSPTETHGLLCAACERMLGWAQVIQPSPDRDTATISAAYGTTRDGGPGSSGAYVLSDWALAHPEFMPEYESAVAGWKTLGSNA